MYLQVYIVPFSALLSKAPTQFGRYHGPSFGTVLMDEPDQLIILLYIQMIVIYILYMDMMIPLWSMDPL